MKIPILLNLPPKLNDKLSKEQTRLRLLRSTPQKEDKTTITGLVVEILTKHFKR